MELNHSFRVPVGADTAFEVLADIERIAPCMPGASVDSVDGHEFTGRVKVKVGPMQVTYRGKAKYAELDRDNHRAVIEARAQETRGSGTANATISAKLDEKGDEETEVNVVSNLSITGRPAQFGRGVMNEVGSKLLNQFADCLSTKLAGREEPEEEAVEEAAETTTAAAGSNGSSAATSEQEITQQVGAAPPQPATGATTAAATAAPSAAAATSGATPAGSSAASSSTGTQPADRATTPGQTSAADVEAIDLFEVAGASVAKRAIPVLAVLLLIVLLIRRRRRR